MKYAYMITFLFAILLSCEREDIGQHQENVRSYLNISVGNQAFTDNTTSSIDIQGSFLDKNKNTINIDKILINGLSVEKDELGNFYMNYNKYKNADNYEALEATLTASRIKIEIDDKEFGDKEISLEVPEPIKIAMPDDFDGVIDKEKGLRIKWAPSTGISRENAQVGASIVYHSSMSKTISNSDNSTKPSSAVSKVQNDSAGEIYFSAQELASFPTDGNVIIYLGRGEQQDFEYGLTSNTVSYVTHSTSKPYTIR